MAVDVGIPWVVIYLLTQDCTSARLAGAARRDAVAPAYGETLDLQAAERDTAIPSPARGVARAVRHGAAEVLDLVSAALGSAGRSAAASRAVLGRVQER
jgi:hypothetical protein